MKNKATTGTKARSRKAAKPPRTAVKILSAPSGPRTVSHSELKKAIEKVFRERHHASA